MPPTDVSPPHPRTPGTADDSGIELTTGDPQADGGGETQDPASHEADQGGHAGPGAEMLKFAVLKESDPTHIHFRRFVELASLSLDLEGNHLEHLGHDLRQMILAGDADVDDFNDRFLAKLGRYYQFGCNLRKILGLDKPSDLLLKKDLDTARRSWGPGQGLHLNALDDDFATLYDMDKFDKMHTLWPHLPLAQRLLAKLEPKTEQSESFRAVYVPGEYVRFVGVGLFNFSLGIFVVAPMVIQTLKVTTAGEKVAIYLVFVLAAGFGIQILVKGFTRQLLVYLAYAGVIAAILR